MRDYTFNEELIAKTIELFGERSPVPVTPQNVREIPMRWAALLNVIGRSLPAIIERQSESE
jgi:hypothetical protein